MTISDGIRKWCDLSEADSIPCNELRELADRIDREMVELPKDRDGVIIRPYDTVWDANGEKREVLYVSLEVPGRTGIVFSMRPGKPGTGGRLVALNPSEVTHTAPDSLGRIADDIELAEKWCDQDGEYGTGISSVEESTLHEWADRIRKLAKEEE